MNLYEAFNMEERKLISKVENIQNRDYSKEEISRIESKVIEEIMSNSKKNIIQVKNEYDRVLNILERHRK